MFTIKFYSGDGCRQRILSAESFTVLRNPIGTDSDGSDGGAEITLHMKNPGEDMRIDVRADVGKPSTIGYPPVYQKAIIENAAGRTTEIIGLNPIGVSRG